MTDMAADVFEIVATCMRGDDEGAAKGVGRNRACDAGVVRGPLDDVVDAESSDPLRAASAVVASRGTIAPGAEIGANGGGGVGVEHDRAGW